MRLKQHNQLAGEEKQRPTPFGKGDMEVSL
jgi:hypothetical protein